MDDTNSPFEIEEYSEIEEIPEEYRNDIPAYRAGIPEEYWFHDDYLIGSGGAVHYVGSGDPPQSAQTDERIHLVGYGDE
jgi:hypothetical protein